MAVDVIDFCLGWGPWPDEAFVDMIRDQCAKRKLSFLICKDDNVNQVIRGVKAGSDVARRKRDAARGCRWPVEGSTYGAP